MTQLISFLPSILPFVPGCSNPVAYEAVKQAIKRLCEVTKVWRYTNNITSSLSILNLHCAPVNAVIVKIDEVRFNGIALTPISVNELNEKNPNWRTEIGTSDPTHFTQIDFDTIRLYPVSVGTIDIDLIIRPVETSNEVPDFIFTHFKDVVASGALSYLYMIPGQSFSSPNLAMVHRREFEQKLAQNNALGIQGQQKSPLRTKPQLF